MFIHVSYSLYIVYVPAKFTPDLFFSRSLFLVFGEEGIRIIYLSMSPIRYILCMSCQKLLPISFSRLFLVLVSSPLSRFLATIDVLQFSYIIQ